MINNDKEIHSTNKGEQTALREKPENQGLAGYFTCPILFEAYDDDPSSIAQQHLSHLPIQSSKCSHRICYSCLTSMQMDAAKEANKDLCDIKWLACPICREDNSFNTDKPIIDLMLCNIIRDLKGKKVDQQKKNEAGQEAEVERKSLMLDQSDLQMVVDGCGVPEINGIYTQTGIFDGVPMYSRTTKFNGREETFSLYRCQLTDKSR